ncbi:MAG: DUF2993 domain-containing protein [Cyanobacteriota bacterium ELA615]
MEILTIVLASLFAVIAPAGVLLEGVLSSFISSNIHSAEKIALRIDNRPSYAVVSGHLDHLRIATRGIEPIEDIRLDVLEIESDPVDIDLGTLRAGNLRQSLRHSLQGALRIELKQSDLNKALASAKIKNKIEQLLPKEIAKQFAIVQINSRFLADNKISLNLQLKQIEDGRLWNLTLESKLKIIGGHTLQLLDPVGSLNGRKLSAKLLKNVVDGLNPQLDLTRLEKNGITARVLQLKLEDGLLRLAFFVRLDPLST